MNRIKLPIANIKVVDRQRPIDEDYCRNELGPSMAAVGLVQPIVVNQDFRLIAGGHRLWTANHLGWTEIDVVYRETLTEDELQELELTENVKRLDLPWQYRCIAVAKIHQLKVKKSAQAAEEWGMLETGKLLGVSKTHTFYCLKIAKLLLSSKDHPAWQSASTADAWKDHVLKAGENALNAELAERQRLATANAEVDSWFEDEALTPPDELIEALPQVDGVKVTIPFLGKPVDALTEEEAKQRYYANPLNPPGSFEDYWAERKKKLDERENTVYITNRIIHSDSIGFMRIHTNEYDHVITDIPYGIDMDMLNQQNPHGGMVNIEDVEEEHKVDDNKELMVKFFPAAFSTLKENGFLITWCDQMLWQFMYDLATKAGFKVQRWPITWHKTHRCMNQCAQYNFTKTTEIAMVCRKGNATLVSPQGESVINASNDDMRRLIGHPFAKPFEAWEFLVKAVSLEGQHILEPFAGRGSGVLSMLQMNRVVTAVEIQEAHYNALLEVVKRFYLKLNPNFKFV